MVKNWIYSIAAVTLVGNGLLHADDYGFSYLVNNTGKTIYYRIFNKNGKQCWPANHGRTALTTSSPQLITSGTIFDACPDPIVSIDVEPSGFNIPDDIINDPRYANLATDVLRFQMVPREPQQKAYTYMINSSLLHKKVPKVFLPVKPSDYKLSPIYETAEKQFKGICRKIWQDSTSVNIINNISQLQITGGPSMLISTKFIPDMDCQGSMD